MKKPVITLIVILISSNLRSQDIVPVFRSPNFVIVDQDLTLHKQNHLKINISSKEETYVSKDKGPDSIGYVNVRAEKGKNGKITSATEFSRLDQSGLKSSYSKFDENGKIMFHTTCDDWIGCLHINKSLCTQLDEELNLSYVNWLGSFTKPSKKEVKKCAAIFSSLFSLPIFQSKTYQQQANKASGLLSDYYGSSNLMVFAVHPEEISSI